MREKSIRTRGNRELLDEYEQMRERATRDALTGLFNRGELERQIQARFQKMGDREGAALFIVDLDNFKEVNDTMGHQTGDEVLVTAAGLLSGMFRATDIVGRLGGDEFVVFLTGNLTEDMMRRKGQMICDQIQLFVGHEKQIVVTASVGIHLDVKKKHNFEAMYRSADRALYRAKESGKGGYCIETRMEDSEEAVMYEPVNAIRLKGLLDHIDSGVAMIEMRDEIRFSYISPTFARMAGVEVAEMMKRPAFDLIEPEDREEFLHLLKTKVVEENGAVNHEVRVHTPDGETGWWRLHAVQVEFNEQNPVILLTGVDISDLKRKESSLKQNNDLFQLALGQSKRGIWEIEMKTKKFRFVVEHYDGRGATEFVDFPEGLIERGWIAAESADEFRDFAGEVVNGMPQGYGNFMVLNQNQGTYIWASFSYRTIFDEENVPVRVVGIIEGMENEGNRTAADPQNTKMPEGLLSSLVVHMRGNISRNTIAYLWSEGKEYTNESDRGTCTEFFKKESGRHVGFKMLGDSDRLFSKEHFREAYAQNGSRWSMEEYQRMDDEGNIHWIVCVVNLYEDSLTRELYNSVWMLKLDQRHFWETGLGVTIYKDSINKLYTRSTVREMANQLISEHEHTQCALVMVEIGGMARLYHEDSEEVDKKWNAILTVLLMAVGTACIPGQFGRDRMILFFPEIAGKEKLRRKLEQAFVFVRTLTADYIDGSLLRFFAGGTCCYRDEADYNLMMKNVQEICSLWRNASGDRVAFSDEINMEGWESIQEVSKIDRVRVPLIEEPKPLTDREKDMAFECILSMLNADSLQESTRAVLQRLGTYYEADRVYILVPVEGGSVVAMPHEWTSDKKASIQQAVSGARLDNFPLLVRCIEEKKPVFLTRNGPSKSKKMWGGEPVDIWHFFVFPMWQDSRAQAYLCIENARRFTSDLALPAFMSSCIMKDRKKYITHAWGASGGGGVSATSIPNFTSNMERIYHFSSDVYHSLGVVCVDVPELARINTIQGFEYGRKLLWFILHTLNEIFERTMVFRTWDAEFMAFCPNVTQQVFQGKCARLQAAFMRRYPKDVRIGRSWSDKVFNGKTLVDEAKELMRCGRLPKTEQRAVRQMEGKGTSVYSIKGELADSGRFAVYLQPKVQLETEEIIGAEALVRGLNEADEPVLPSAFLDRLKANGAVRNLDLFVLDKTMRFMEQCREEGRRILPVSVNFSNVTILDERMFASILAIHSRYPQIKPELLEIELQEEDCGIRIDRLAEQIWKLQEYGIRFALDNVRTEPEKLPILKKIDFASLKLNRSLVQSAADEEESRCVIEKLVNYCQKKQIRCIAGGIESMEQAVSLTREGCVYGQGYYYEYPIPAKEFGRKYLV